MKLLSLAVGVVLFLIGTYLQNKHKGSIAAWCFMGAEGLLWVTSIYS